MLLSPQTQASRMTNKNGRVRQIILAPIKWVLSNILFPFLPVAVKLLINWFSASNTNALDPNDLLYYSFFICILLLDLLKKKDTIFSNVVYFVFRIICVVDIIIIALVTIGQHNPETTQSFAIWISIACACFGSAFVLVQAFLAPTQEVEQNG